MDDHIKQLISKIKEATFNIRPPRSLWNSADVNNEVELEDMAYVEKYIDGKKEPIEKITGIAQTLLPSPENLSYEHRAILAKELEYLLKHFNFYLDFPKELPAELRYQVIYSFWKEEHVAVSFGENHIELCDMEKENCPFPGYCQTCDEVAAQMKHDEETGTIASDEDFNVDDLIPSPQQMEEWHAKNDIEPNEDESYHEEINGFYNDAGEKIEPESVPVPGLCVICKQHLSDDWEENLLCLMNRYDQRNNDDFKCGAFEKI